jgi:sugar phosphate isomerase/epimerase
MIVGLSTAHLLASEATVAAILDEVAALAPAAVELAAGGPAGLQRALAGAVATARQGLPLVALEAFFPGPRPLAGPALTAPDAGERAAAQKLCERSILTAAELGARVVVVALGAVGFDAEKEQLRQAFERGELDAKTWQRKRAERAAAAPPHLDAARLALEPLLRLAEAATVTLAVCNRPDYDQIPDPDEVARLLADFRGAPLGTWFDSAAAHVQEALGAAPAGAHLAAFGRAAVGVHLGDAAGLARGLAPGTGVIDFAALKPALPAEAPLFVHCAPGVFRREVHEALAEMRRIFVG